MSDPKHTPGPWLPGISLEYDEKLDGDAEVKTGWIVGVVEYAGCGSHRAEWKNPADFELALAAPELLALVKELTDSGECWYDHHGYCQAHSLDKNCQHGRAKLIIAKLEAKPRTLPTRTI